MGDINESFCHHLSLLDKHSIYGNNLDNGILGLLKPFIDSLKDDGALPYLIGDNKRFRASPLASSIIWLEDVGLLPLDVIDILQDKLIFLKENCENSDSSKSFYSKEDDDVDAWSYCEGASVWSTSLAIIALLDHQGNGIKKVSEFKNSVLWLVEQQKLEDKGWAYQKWDNCSVNAIMTSLAMQALALVLYPQNVDKFNFTDNEKKSIIKSINIGCEYLQTNIVKKKNHAYWCFEGKPSCIATTWSLLALKRSMNITNINKDVNSFYESIIFKCIDFIVSDMPLENERWEDEEIVREGGAKYGKQKNYFSFTPTLLTQLFELGLSPYHPKVINQIKWLLNNRNDWKILKYDVGSECTFTCAMTVAVIYKWFVMVGYNAGVLLSQSRNIKDKLTVFLFGFTSPNGCPERIVLKKKIDSWNTLCVTLIFVAFLLPHFDAIAKCVEVILQNVLPSSDDWHTIYINLISTALFSALTLLFTVVWKLTRRWIIK